MKGKKYHVRFMKTARKLFLEIMKKGNYPTCQIVRVNILLKLDEGGKTKTTPEQVEIAQQC
jgi:hypothetical protein